MDKHFGFLYLLPPNDGDSEEFIQRAFAQWVKKFLPSNVFAFSVPNENGGSKAFGSRLNLTGRRAGVGDFTIVYGGIYHALEFKTAMGRQSKEQVKAEADTIAAGGKYAIARSCQAGIDQLNKWGIPHSFPG